jgi:N-acylneuraminate cytidylyltransferase/CMP-N,N'-diacetyllegionaminic acid synthase
MIGWTIEAACGSRNLHRTIVSTDDLEIAAVAKSFGAQVPFLRPAELAADDTPHSLVMRHAIRWLAEDEGAEPHYIVLLQPTSPLRTAQDIDAAIELAIDKSAESVISVCTANPHPYWSKRILADGRLQELVHVKKEEEYQRRQSLPDAFVMNGAIYVIRSSLLMRSDAYLTDQTYAYVMPPERSVDVDTRWHAEIAQMALQQRDAARRE